MIRKFAKDRDLDEVMKIWYEENCKAHSFIEDSYWESKIEYVKEAIGKADVYVFENEYGLCGFAGIQGTYIEGIFVKEEFQNKGIGSRLMRFLKLGTNELELAVYEKNEMARKFYDKQGFAFKQRQTDQNTGQYELILSWRR